ncbi:MAG TPA: hypothetical protein VEJ63_23110 [Planctomycetota bacterium]|nr:hypothetical protein [Planctomycetota bacterium]
MYEEIFENDADNINVRPALIYEAKRLAALPAPAKLSHEDEQILRVVFRLIPRRYTMAIGINFKRRPPLKLLDQYQVNIKSDTPFKSWCRLQQSMYRCRKGWPTGVHPRTGDPLGSMLAKTVEPETNFLSTAIFAEVEKRLQKDNREEHDNIETKRLFQNMLTSQTLCFNLFIPMLLDYGMATALWKPYIPGIEAINEIKIEHSPGRLDCERGTGDKSAFDACLFYTHLDGKCGVVAIEVKWTEPFSKPAGDPLPRHIELQQKLYNEDGWTKAREMPTQQLWRTHLLAECLRTDKRPHITYLVLYAEADEDCSKLLPGYRNCLALSSSETPRFASVTLEDFVDRANKSALAPEHKTWLDKFHERYLDWSAVETAVQELRAT